MNTQDIEHNFAYHAPANDTVKDAHQYLRYACEEVAHKINELCVDGREKSIAITKLEEAMMWANASIARHGLQ